MKQEKLKTIKAYLSEVSATLDKLPVERIVQVIEVLEDVRMNGMKVAKSK